MRLIDSDKLENDIVENITVKAVSRMLAITQGQPIVKAIPIEWIEKWLDKKTGTKIGDEIGYLEEDKKLLIGFIYWLVSDWEKENEQV